MRILAWRSRQPPLVSWGASVLAFLVALAARAELGRMHGANPGLAFYPLILLTTVFVGWRQALLVLGLSTVAGIYLFLSPDMYLLPIGWVLVGGLNIAIIAALTAGAEALAAAHERQNLLFQELQHRVANTLQSVSGTLDGARRRIASAPEEAVRLIEDAAERFAASADVHRRLSDPTLFQRSLGSILRDAVAAVIDHRSVCLTVDVDDISLSFDQMSAITMLVLEVANNAQKHVFQRELGTAFVVALKALPDRQAMLTVRDDGPGLARNPDTPSGEPRLGFRIMRGLARELNGAFSVTPGKGVEIIVEFPVDR